MSGGVDSAVAAYLLKLEGHEVIGVTLRTWQSEDGTGSRCCEIDDARETARSLGIKYYAFNCIGEFEKYVVGPFVESYIGGFTPNPCVICNSKIKWEQLIYHADVLKADFIATGHYASVIRLENGRYTVKKALHAEKDQTYMLYRLTQRQLERTLMPLGNYSKAEVREIAKAAGLGVAGKKDSQEICFVTGGTYADFIEKNAQGRLLGEGYFLDENANILGRHKGIIHYTVGQRKGLGIPFDKPMFVKRINAETNEIVLAPYEDTGTDVLICKELNFLSINTPKPGDRFKCIVKIRSRHQGSAAEASVLDNGCLKVIFDECVRSAAPGQSAVFYDGGGCVIGGGVIAETYKR